MDRSDPAGEIHSKTAPAPFPNPESTPGKSKLNGPDFMLLAGLTSFAEWIGLNEDWFPFGTPEDCDDLLQRCGGPSRDLANRHWIQSAGHCQSRFRATALRGCVPF